MSKAVIWDFNGTILSDVELSVEGLNLLRTRRRMEPVSAQQYRDVFGFPIEDYYRSIGFDTAQEDFGVLSREYHDHYFANVHRCTTHRHIPELMRELHTLGVRQFVLSAMYESELRVAMDRLALTRFVEAVYGLGDLLARSKVERGHELVKHLGLAGSDIVLIGDTEHDIEVARELGVLPITLTIGHQSAHRFAPFDNPRADSVDALRELLLAWVDGQPN